MAFGVNQSPSREGERSLPASLRKSLHERVGVTVWSRRMELGTSLVSDG